MACSPRHPDQNGDNHHDAAHSSQHNKSRSPFVSLFLLGVYCLLFTLLFLQINPTTRSTLASCSQGLHQHDYDHVMDDDMTPTSSRTSNTGPSLPDSLPWGYHSPRELLERPLRFPSIEQRVQVYLSNWYAPPCNIKQDAFFYHFEEVANDKTVADATHPRKKKVVLPNLIIQEPKSLAPSETYVAVAEMLHARLVYYTDHVFMPSQRQRCKRCGDVVNSLTAVLHEQKAPPKNTTTKNTDRFLDQQEEKVVNIPQRPVLLQFGDRVMPQAYITQRAQVANVMTIPYLSKVRHAVPRDALDTWTGADYCRNGSAMLNGQPKNTKDVTFPLMQPVVWKLSYERHYGMLPQIPRSDIPWEQKIDGAMFRGSATGLKKWSTAAEGPTKISELSSEERCALMPRCQLVARCAQSSTMSSQHLNVALTGGKYDLPEAYFGDSMNFTQQLLYKAVIVVEGNDMATGFKWALYSNSVVMSPKPRFTSWAMEELLEPWVHYIPLADDFSDIEEKVQWMLDHDDEAQAIAHRGQLWINDLVFHPDVPAEEEEIFRRMVGRFQTHFWPQPGPGAPKKRHRESHGQKRGTVSSSR